MDIEIRKSNLFFDGETILTISEYQTAKDNSITNVLTLKTYDISGNLLGEKSPYPENTGLTNVTLNDGVIEVYSTTTDEFILYNSDLKELF